jgi:hypothetical protein
MAKLNELKIDEEKASKGIWCQYDDETEFLIGSVNGRDFERELSKLYRPYHSPGKKHLLNNPDILLSTRCKALSRHVLLGWKGLTDGPDGQEKEVPFSEEAAFQLLMQSAVIRSFVEDEGSNQASFSAAAKEAAAENIKSGSDVAH